MVSSTEGGAGAERRQAGTAGLPRQGCQAPRLFVGSGDQLHLFLAESSFLHCPCAPAVWHWGQTAKMELVRNGRTLLRDLFEEDRGPADTGKLFVCMCMLGCKAAQLKRAALQLSSCQPPPTCTC